MYKIHNKTERQITINLGNRGVEGDHRDSTRFRFPPGTVRLSRKRYEQIKDHWYFKKHLDANNLRVAFKDAEAEEIQKETEAFIADQQKQYKDSSIEAINEINDAEDELRGVPEAIRKEVVAEAEAAAEEAEELKDQALANPIVVDEEGKTAKPARKKATAKSRKATKK